MGMNGLDVAGLRPFDLVIPFTIQKGEITGDGRSGGGASWTGTSWTRTTFTVSLFSSSRRRPDAFWKSSQT